MTKYQVDPSAVRSELDRVLASSYFAASGRLACFLRYIIAETLAGREADIKEYTIGVTVYGKPADYDPKTDATIRGEASRLRTRLREYYQSNAPQPGGIRIDVPKGAYVPLFTPVRNGSPDSDSSPASLQSLAVLPFKPLLGRQDESEQAIGLALADALITTIGALPGIIVRPTSAVARYVNTELDALSAARELQAATVLEGNFQHVGDRIRVSLQLLRTSNGKHLWTAFYDEDFRDPFSIQDKLAQQLARALQLRLQEDVDLPALAGRRVNTSAYSHYVLGRYHLFRSTPDGARKALEAFQAAIAADPESAQAHANLALAHGQRADLLLTTYRQVSDQMTMAAARAISLDPELPEAITAVGVVQFRCHWDWHNARRSFERVLNLRCTEVEVYLYHAQLLDALGHSAEAQELCRQAIRRCPVSPTAYLWLSCSYWFQRDYDESISWAHRTLELDPHNALAMARLVDARYVRGEYEQWAMQLMDMFGNWEKSATEVPGMRAAYRKGGWKELMRYYLKERQTRRLLTGSFGADAWWLAPYYAEMGDLDTTFTCLEEAYMDRSSALAYLKVDPRWDRVRTDPQFGSLVARVGLP